MHASNVGGEAQQWQAPRDLNGGQVNLLPRGRVSICLDTHTTHARQRDNNAVCACVCARRVHQRYLERRGQRFTKGALDPIQCEVDALVETPEHTPT